MLRLTDFAKQTLLTLGSKIIVLGLGLVTSIILARGLGPEGRGIYALAILFPTLIVSFLNFGLGTATVYYVAQEKHPLKDVFSSNSILVIGIGIAGVFIGLGLTYLFPDRIYPEVPTEYLILALLLVPLNLYIGQVGTQILLGSRKMKTFNAATIANSLVFLILLSIAILALNLGTVGAVTANVMNAAILSIFLFVTIFRLAGGFSFRISREYIRDAFNYGSRTYIGSIVNFLNYRIEIFILGVMMPAAALGYYSVAVGLAERMWLVSQSAATVIFPTIAAEKDDEKRKQFTPIISRNVLLITFLGAAVLFLISPWLITLFYTESYRQTIYLFRMLLPGVVFLSASRVLANDIAGRGKPLLNTYVGVFGLVVQVILNLLLIPQYGAAGSAVATSISYGLILIVRSWLYRRVSGNTYVTFLLPHQSDLALYLRLMNLSLDWLRAKLSHIRGKFKD